MCNRVLKKYLAALIAFVMIMTMMPAASLAQDDVPGDTPEEPTLQVWSLEEAIGDFTHGQAITGVPALGVAGGATLTAHDMVINDVHGWEHLYREFNGLSVARPAAADALMICPVALGLEPGQIYVWNIEGVRPVAGYRPAFAPVHGEAVGAATFVTPITANANRLGYFTMQVSIEHAADITAYSLHGVAATGTNPVRAAGDFNIAAINVRRTNSYLLFETDFSDGLGPVRRGAGEQVDFDIIPDYREPGNYVIRASMEGPGWAGIDINWRTMEEYGVPVPEGSLVEATIVARQVGGISLGSPQWRIATRVGDVVANWGAANARVPLGTDWTTYTVRFQLPVGTGVQAFQFCKDVELNCAIVEFNSVQIYILDDPGAITAVWQCMTEIPRLAEAFTDYFTIGNILDAAPEPGGDVENMFLHLYNSITAENCMKPVSLSNAPFVYTLDHATAFSQWAVDQGIELIGHTLVWHGQSAAWLNLNEDTSPVTYAEARYNLEHFIRTVAGHFSGKVDAWDVLNELFHSGGGNANLRWWQNIRTNSINGHPWRAAYANQAPDGVNPWDFVYDAFKLARRYAPDARLIYNDYNNDSVQKSANIRDMVNNINAIWATDEVNNPEAYAGYGIPGLGNNAVEWRANDVAIVEAYIADGGRLLIETIGGQTHFGINTNMNNVRLAFDNFFGAVGVCFQITELDIGAGAGISYNPNSQRTRYRELFELWMDNAHRIDRVTFWGINDVQSWIATNATLFSRPTAYDPVFRAKPALFDIAALPGNFASTGLDAQYLTEMDRLKVGTPTSFEIALQARGDARFNVTDTPNVDNFIVNGLPQGLSVTAVDIIDDRNAIITISGTPTNSGSFGIHPQVRIREGGSASIGDNNRVRGNFIGTRLIQPMPLEVVTDWDLALEPAVRDAAEGAVIPYAGPMSPGGNAVITARKDVELLCAYGHPERNLITEHAIEVTRPAAADGLLFDPVALGLVPGNVYIWDITGVRLRGNHQAAFGTVNAAGATTIIGTRHDSGNYPRFGVVASNPEIGAEHFTIRRVITHTEAIQAYRFYGVVAGGQGANVAQTGGDFQIHRMTITETTPEVAFATDFRGGPDAGTGYLDYAWHHWSPLEGTDKFAVERSETAATGNYVARATIAPGVVDLEHGFGVAIPNFPTGAAFRATFVARRVEGATHNFRLRAVGGTDGVIYDHNVWGNHTQALGENWTTYTLTGEFPLGAAPLEFQLIRTNGTWAGTIELDSVKIEILNRPGIEGVRHTGLPSLAEAFDGIFRIGNILDMKPIPGSTMETHFLEQYNVLTVENAMKPQFLSPAPGVYTWDVADELVDWALDNGLEVVGHTLAWHAASPPYLNAMSTTYLQAQANMRRFIRDVATHYRGRVVAWDVFNEIFVTPGHANHATWQDGVRAATLTTGHAWRRSYMTETPTGAHWSDFVYDAFRFARYYDPYAILAYNDYNDDNAGKARLIMMMTNCLNARWARDTENNPEAMPHLTGTDAEIVRAYLDGGGRLLVEALGLQAHYSLSGNWRALLDRIRASYDIYRQAVGVTIEISELDVTAPNHQGNTGDYRPDLQYEFYRELFEIFLDNSDIITRVSWWGTSDLNSWRWNGNPTIFSRATFFDPVFRAKPIFHTLIDMAENFVPRVVVIGSESDTPGDGEFAPGTEVTIDAGAKEGYFFAGWLVTPTDVELTVDPENPAKATFTMPQTRVTATATWVEESTLTFHLYTDNQRILDTFAAYTTDVNGSVAIVVPVVPGSAPDLGDVLNIGRIYGTAQAHGYAFWGWFDDEMLDESGRMRAGLRRPALTVPEEEDICRLAYLLEFIENATAAEFLSLFNNGNLDLYGVWVRWGDVDDNGVVNMTDLSVLQRHVNFAHIIPTALSLPAADVVVDGQVNMKDLSLLQRHTNLGHIMTVVLGEQPEPAFTVSATLMGAPVDLTEGLDMVIQMWADLTASHEVVWSICNPAIATIDENGRVVAVGANHGNVGFHFTMRNPAGFPYMGNLDEIRHDNFADGWRQYNPTVRDFDGNAVITATRVSDGAVIEIPVVTTTATRGHLNYAEPLKDTFADYFLIGNIIGNNPQQQANITANHRRHFNVLTYENNMKPNQTGPEGALNVATGIFTMPETQANNLTTRVTSALRYGHYLLGHTMYWHNQHARWSSTIQLQTVYNNAANVVRNDSEFVGTAEEREAAARAAGTQAVVSVMNQYAKQYAGRPGIRGNIRSWDVINELFVDDNEFATPAYAAAASWQQAVRQNVRNLPPNTAYEFAYLDVSPMSHWEANGGAVPAGLNGNLNNPWARVLGPEDMVFYAFLSVRRADPYAILKYNDFNTSLPNKQRWIFDMITYINDRYANSEYKLEMMALHGESYGPADRKLIEGLGLQEHINLAQHLTGPVQSLVDQFDFFRPLGINLWVTELDIECMTSAQRNNSPPLVYQPGYPGNQAANFRSYAGIVRQAEFYYHMFRVYLANADILEQVTWWGLTGSWRNAGDPLPWHTQGGAAGPHNGALKPAWFGIMRALEAHEAGRPHILPPPAVVDNWQGD